MKIEKGMFVLVNGRVLQVEEVDSSGSFWGTDQDGGDYEIEFGEEQVTAIIPEFDN